MGGYSPGQRLEVGERNHRWRFPLFEYAYQMLVALKRLSLFYKTSSVDKGFQGSSVFPHL